jgi:hypothetical protein
MIPGTDNRHKRKPIDNGSTTTSKKACNTRDDIDTEIVRKNLDFKRWLMTLVRSASLTESEENDIGTLGFLVKKNIYSVPFTGLLKLMDASSMKTDTKFQKIKGILEQNFGPVSDVAKNLDLLADSIRNGAKLAREAGICTAPTEDEDEDEGEDEDEDEDEGEDED